MGLNSLQFFALASFLSPYIQRLNFRGFIEERGLKNVFGMWNRGFVNKWIRLENWKNLVNWRGSLILWGDRGRFGFWRKIFETFIRENLVINIPTLILHLLMFALGQLVKMSLDWHHTFGNPSSQCNVSLCNNSHTF